MYKSCLGTTSTMMVCCNVKTSEYFSAMYHLRLRKKLERAHQVLARLPVQRKASMIAQETAFSRGLTIRTRLFASPITSLVNEIL